MSYLSSYTLTDTGFSAFRGLQPYSGNAASFSLPQHPADSYSIISYNTTSSQLRSAFVIGTAGGINIYGFRAIKGLGNAMLSNAAGVTVNVNIDTATVWDTVKFTSKGGVACSFANPSSSSLVAVYNLGLNAGEGTLSFTAFNNHTSLSTVTVDYISANIYYTGSTFNFVNCALTAQSVENILVAANNGITQSGTGVNMNLSGGTSAGASALTAAAAAARTALIAKGVSITLNP